MNASETTYNYLTKNWLPQNEVVSISLLQASFNLSKEACYEIIKRWLANNLITRVFDQPTLYVVNNDKRDN